MNHLGALPYVISKFGLNCPIYATLPVRNMGLVKISKERKERKNTIKNDGKNKQTNKKTKQKKKMFLYEACLSRQRREDFETFNLDDVDEAFSDKRWTILKYSQRESLQGCNRTKDEKIL